MRHSDNSGDIVLCFLTAMSRLGFKKCFPSYDDFNAFVVKFRL